jgi:hypothetical protein
MGTEVKATRGDPKKLKKRHQEKLLRMALDGRRRPADRKWAREQLALSGYDIGFIK